MCCSSLSLPKANAHHLKTWNKEKVVTMMTRKVAASFSLAIAVFLFIQLSCITQAFSNSWMIQNTLRRSGDLSNASLRRPLSKTTFRMVAEPVTQKEAQAAIDKVVAALRKDKRAQSELGNLFKVTHVLGYGCPIPGSIAVRFNAQFQKNGFGRSAVPLPFGLGQSTKSEGRGTMVGQVKASVDEKTGKLKECSVFRDLGYGRAFNLKC